MIRVQSSALLRNHCKCFFGEANPKSLTTPGWNKKETKRKRSFQEAIVITEEFGLVP